MIILLLLLLLLLLVVVVVVVLTWIIMIELFIHLYYQGGNYDGILFASGLLQTVIYRLYMYAIHCMVYFW